MPHHRGESNYRTSGEVDAMRIPKDGFYAHQVMWDGWGDVERPRAHLLGHWNYTADVVKPVHVISSADVVELRLNGKSLGRVTTPEHRFLFTFTVDGPAEWRGGIAQGPDNHILSLNLPVECGVNRAFIRSTPTPGKITVRATAAGLKPAELVLTSSPVPAALSAGVYPVLPDTRPSFLRPAPPPTPSYRVTRTPVAIASAKTDANAAQTAAAYDDNERSSWTGGKWIEFTLARKAKLTELTASFPNWRSRTYPILVTVDGKEAWRGVTPTSLGYVTLPLKPVEGRVVRIQLIGESAANADFANITELSNAANATDGPSVAKGTLGLVEIEFYEPAR